MHCRKKIVVWELVQRLWSCRASMAPGMNMGFTGCVCVCFNIFKLFERSYRLDRCFHCVSEIVCVVKLFGVRGI